MYVGYVQRWWISRWEFFKADVVKYSEISFVSQTINSRFVLSPKFVDGLMGISWATTRSYDVAIAGRFRVRITAVWKHWISTEFYWSPSLILNLLLYGLYNYTQPTSTHIHRCLRTHTHIHTIIKIHTWYIYIYNYIYVYIYNYIYIYIYIYN